MTSVDNAGGLRVELLGPVEAWVDGTRVALGGQRPRTLLAVLALMRGRTVSSERLIDELWGEAPPARARESVQVHVSRLRKALSETGGDPRRLVNDAGGYRLRLDSGALDLDRWEAALSRARRERAAGRLEAARPAIEEALAIWRGAPLGGVIAHALVDGERARLEEEHLAATIERVELDLELGRHGELLGRLEALIASHPFKERLVALQMLALYRCGRQADALAAFRAARARFVEELGVEPGQALRTLHDDVLRHAATLGAEPTPARTGKRRLPVPPNRTIGRRAALAAIGERLRADSPRLLTLTGPGGVGKTRLALEAARELKPEFADGACFVSLAPVRRAEDVPAAIVQALGTLVLGRESPEEALQRFLATKHLLLVVDNCEHVLAAAPSLGRLLEGCPALKALATSREPLGLHAEQRYAVSPLALPERGMLGDPQALAGVDAVALFVERARAHCPDLDPTGADPVAIAQICRRLDGLPLAIELAAARCGVLSVGEIAERLDSALSALGAGPRDAPARQQTLRATIDWSHDLLGNDEQRCFARFAVFAGGATVGAAEAITGAELDTLDRLVAKSLLVRRRQRDGHTRLHMLETLRAYAAERFTLDAAAEAVREHHYRHYLALVEHHGSERALRGADAVAHLAQLDAETDNVHVALAWAIEHADGERAITLAAALGCYWITRARYADALDWLDQALDLPGADAQPALRVRALGTKAVCLWDVGRGAEQPMVFATMEAEARRLGDPVLISRALQHRAAQVLNTDRVDAAAALADAAHHWATVSGDEWEIAEASRAQATAATTLADLRERVETAASLLTNAGNVHQLASLLTSAAYAALCLGSERDAVVFASRATPIARTLDSPFERMINSGNTGLAALLTGDTDAAAQAFRDELMLCRELAVRPVAFEGLLGLAALAVLDGDDQRAATLVGAAAAHRYDNAQDRVEIRLDKTFFEPARTRSGTRAWDAAAREGGTLSFEDAIAYALEASPARAPALS